MCTATTFKSKDFYCGRTLDNEFSYHEQVVVVPRNFLFNFRHCGEMKHHLAIVGMAFVQQGYPLFYDGVNECGVSMMGLNFPGNAVYNDELVNGKDNVAQFELLPWILAQCKSVLDVRKLLADINILSESFSVQLPSAQLHWMIADKDECIVLECMRDGMKIYDNPVGVMTNNPPFYYHLTNLNNYLNLSPNQVLNTFSTNVQLSSYCKGMGAIGLPGDLSSASRFVRASFVRNNLVCGEDEKSAVSGVFHILGSVDQQKGANRLDVDMYEMTIYTSCMNATKGIYYYNTYDNHQINAVDMHRENLDSDQLIAYDLATKNNIHMHN